MRNRGFGYLFLGVILTHYLVGCRPSMQAEDNAVSIEALQPASNPIPLRPVLPALNEGEEQARLALLDDLMDDQYETVHTAITELVKDDYASLRNSVEVLKVLFEEGYFETPCYSKNREVNRRFTLKILEKQLQSLKLGGYKSRIIYEILEFQTNSGLSVDDQYKISEMLYGIMFTHSDGATVIPDYGSIRLINSLKGHRDFPLENVGMHPCRVIMTLAQIDHVNRTYIEQIMLDESCHGELIYWIRRGEQVWVSAKEYEVLKELSPEEWLKGLLENSEKDYLIYLLMGTNERVIEHYPLVVKFYQQYPYGNSSAIGSIDAPYQALLFPAYVHSSERDKQRLDAVLNLFEERISSRNCSSGDVIGLYKCVYGKNTDIDNPKSIYGFERIINLLAEILFDAEPRVAIRALGVFEDIAQDDYKVKRYAQDCIEKCLLNLDNKPTLSDDENMLRKALVT